VQEFAPAGEHLEGPKQQTEWQQPRFVEGAELEQHHLSLVLAWHQGSVTGSLGPIFHPKWEDGLIVKEKGVQNEV
jgi:hypothetical protein